MQLAFFQVLLTDIKYGSSPFLKCYLSLCIYMYITISDMVTRCPAPSCSSKCYTQCLYKTVVYSHFIRKYLQLHLHNHMIGICNTAAIARSVTYTEPLCVPDFRWNVSKRKSSSSSLITCIVDASSRATLCRKESACAFIWTHFPPHPLY